MKKKFIVASAIGLLGITSMAIGTITLAGNTKIGGQRTYMHSGAKIAMGSGGFMGTGCGYGPRMGSGDRMKDGMMRQFASTGDAEAFRTAVNTAITNNDYTAYVAANTRYDISKYMNKDEFTAMVTERATQEKIKTALTNGDYTTWKTLSKENPIAAKIDTEAKFKKLQEIETYRQKINDLGTELGIESGKDKGIGMGMGDGRMGMGRGMRMGPKNQ